MPLKPPSPIALPLTPSDRIKIKGPPVTLPAGFFLLYRRRGGAAGIHPEDPRRETGYSGPLPGKRPVARS